MISVMVASMGRPSLVDTLRRVAAATVPAGETLEVVVADDSPDGAVARLLAAADLPLGVTIVPVGQGNVSLARNACLDHAQGDWLIFVDDDEIVEPGWLIGHLSAATEFAADAVFGPVYPLYPEGTPDWFIKANPLFQDWRWGENGRTIGYGRTGNTLIRRSALGGLRFDPAFGRSGGEDHDFFLRFAAAGHRMVVTDRARASEFVPADRATVRYALHRATRQGQIYAVTALKGRGPGAQLIFGADALVKLAIAAIAAALVAPFDRPRALRLGMRRARNLGKLKGLSRAGLMQAWA